MQSTIKRIGVLTSGGDAPGMNAAIRAVVRAARYYQLNVTGIQRGYDGLIKGEFVEMNSQSVSNIIQRGGTILKTARSNEFRTVEGRKQAFAQLKQQSIDALIVIGGDGTFAGARLLGTEFSIPIVGIAGTIDNDLWGTDFAIGYDTAINTVINAVDKLRDTAESHDRVFIVEVMGRDSGLIALRSGIGAGAEAILIPESQTDIDALLLRLETSRKDKASKIIMVAEGDEMGGALQVARILEERFPKRYDIRVSILGHIQRGGAPSCLDRVLASRLGVAAVEALLAGRQAEMVGIVKGEFSYIPFEQAIKHIGEVNPNLLKLVEILSL